MCFPADDTELFLLIASRRSVVRSNMEVWLYDQLPLPGFQSLTAIDMDVRNGNIFFSDTAWKKIFRSTYNGTNLTEVGVEQSLHAQNCVVFRCQSLRAVPLAVNGVAEGHHEC